ncbi:unnamed protein product [Victoria cruziana]
MHNREGFILIDDSSTSCFGPWSLGEEDPLCLREA